LSHAPPPAAECLSVIAESRPQIKAVAYVGISDTTKEKVDFLFFGLVDGFVPELGYFSLNELKTAKEGLRGLQALPIERDVWFREQRLSEVRRRHNI
jgi:hypothetical protein